MATTPQQTLQAAQQTLQAAQQTLQLIQSCHNNTKRKFDAALSKRKELRDHSTGQSAVTGRAFNAMMHGLLDPKRFEATRRVDDADREALERATDRVRRLRRRLRIVREALEEASEAQREATWRAAAAAQRGRHSSWRRGGARGRRVWRPTGNGGREYRDGLP